MYLKFIWNMCNFYSVSRIYIYKYVVKNGKMDVMYIYYNQTFFIKIIFLMCNYLKDKILSFSYHIWAGFEV